MFQTNNRAWRGFENLNGNSGRPCGWSILNALPVRGESPPAIRISVHNDNHDMGMDNHDMVHKSRL